jgi:hypothetical protein
VVCRIEIACLPLQCEVRDFEDLRLANVRACTTCSQHFDVHTMLNKYHNTISKAGTCTNILRKGAMETESSGKGTKLSNRLGPSPGRRLINKNTEGLLSAKLSGYLRKMYWASSQGMICSAELLQSFLIFTKMHAHRFTLYQASWQASLPTRSLPY